MAKTDAPTEEAPVEEAPVEEAPIEDVDETIVDKILELFQSNEATIDYGQDPQRWVDENLPEGTEAADVARCIPEVTERLGGPYQANAARYNAHHGAHGHAATHSVVNELNYTYNTVYQQNAFIYAEEGAQVVNIQGDGNTVNQTQIDLEFNVDTPEYDDEYEDGELPEELPVDEHGDPIMDDHDDLEDEGDDIAETDPTDEEDPMGEEPWAEEDDPSTTEDPAGDDGTDDPWDDLPEAPVDEAMVDPEPDPVGPVTDAPEANPFEGAEELML